MGLTEGLSAEHRVIEKVLTAVDNLASLHGEGVSARPEFFLEAADFIRNFADGCHHRKEEDILFEALAGAGFSKEAGPVAVMLSEHVQGRLFVKAMTEAAERWKAGDASAAGEVIRNAQGYTCLLRQHIQKEDAVLFPMSEARIAKTEQKRIAEEFAGLDAVDEKAGHAAKYKDLAEKLLKESFEASLNTAHCPISRPPGTVVSSKDQTATQAEK